MRSIEVIVSDPGQTQEADAWELTLLVPPRCVCVCVCVCVCIKFKITKQSN